jgi:hypothetical protein
MTSPNWTPSHIDPVVLPPDIESTAFTYLSAVVTPTPVATRMPNPDLEADTINDFLRIEAAGGNRANFLEWDASFLMHAYSPDEMRASALAQKATAYAAGARGQLIDGAYVLRVINTVAPTRLTDPNVNLIRYRSMVTWRMPGRLVTAGS